MVVDRRAAILRFSNDGKPRRLRFDQIRRHPNGKVQPAGRLLPSREPRNFRYHGIDGLTVESPASLKHPELRVELHGLTTSALRHHTIWTNWSRTNLRHLPDRLRHPGFETRARRLIDNRIEPNQQVQAAAYISRKPVQTSERSALIGTLSSIRG